MPFSLEGGFRKMLKDYLKNTSLSGYSYIVEKNRSIFEKTLWAIINISLLAVTTFLVRSLWFSFLDNPTVTSLQSTSYSIEKVPFPGVSICNINKISKSRAMNLSEHISKWASNVSVEEAMKMFHVLGSMHDFSAEHDDDLQRFQEIFEELHNKGFLTIDLNLLIKSLTEPCDKLLLSCKWGGNKVPCDEIFKLRLSFEGYCCIFNYVKPDKSSTSQATKDVLYQQAGFDKGLTVVVENNPSDYFYAFLSTIGVSVHIFNANDYPDVSSGSLIQHILPHGSESFLAVVPTVFETKSSVMDFPIEKRQCYFAKEKKTLLGKYTQSDCMVECRIESMMTLCNCIPFMIPTNDSDTICTVLDIPCLEKYKRITHIMTLKIKWRAVAPDSNDERVAREKQNALACKDYCYPSCESTLYYVELNSLPLANKTHENKSVIHIYFRKSFVHLYSKDVVYYWFEILSNFGGIFGLMIGLSLISVVEIIVYLTYKLCSFSTN